MKIIKPNAELLTHDIPAYQFIEKVGRTCYKSEDKITDTSAINFVKALVKNKHLAMLEHEYLYLVFTGKYGDQLLNEFLLNENIFTTKNRHLFNYINIDSDKLYLSGSFRSWIELFDNFRDKRVNITRFHYTLYMLLNKDYPEIFNDFFYLHEPIVYDGYEDSIVIISREELENELKNVFIPSHLLPHTIKFTCDRGVSHEFVRHRPASFAQESTRYCNYSNDKFDNELIFIKPPFWDIESDNYASWYDICTRSETAYLEMLKNGATPEQARSILPNSLKTELIITATEEEWQHIVDLRYHGTTGKPHPQMKEVMDIAYPLLVQSSEGRIQ